MNSKKIFRLSTLLVFLCAFISCSQDDTVDQLPISAETGEKVDVKLNFEGDILEFNRASTRSGEESLDLIGIEIARSPIGEDDYKPYLVGLFDDMQKAMNFTLFTDYKYTIRATMVPNGKYKIYGAHWEEDGVLYHRYKDPFYIQLTNDLRADYRLTYENSSFNLSRCSTVPINGDESFGSYAYTDVDRFYGEVINYIPTSDSNVTLQLKRVSSRLILNVKGLRSFIKMQINCNADGHPSSELYTYGNFNGDPIQNIKFISLMGEAVDWESHDGLYTYTPNWLANPVNTTSVKVLWYREDGTVVVLFDEFVTFQAGKTKTFDFDLSSYYGSGPVIELPDEWD